MQDIIYRQPNERVLDFPFKIHTGYPDTYTHNEGDNIMTTETERQLADALQTINELKKQLREAEYRILRLEKTPATATQVIVEKELEEPAIRVTVDKKKGEVYDSRYS